MEPVIVVIILVALAFDFLNGFHDAANSIATVVSTRVLSPRKAVLWAAFFNFVAAFVMGTHVAKTMIFIVLPPLMGLLLGFFLMVGVTRMFRRWHPFKLDQVFRRAQLVSAGL